MRNYKKIVVVILTLIILSITIWFYFSNLNNSKINNNIEEVTTNIELPFVYNFNTDENLYEAGSMNESTSPYWWLNSGAYMDISKNVGKTVQGSLDSSNVWRQTYSKTNPLDTDNGYHPQNIFRLVTKYKLQNSEEEAYFKITSNNFSSSPNRNESNGLLLFERYVDHNNLYYAGVRVDGFAIIKKKINGTYFTLGSKNLFSNSAYDKNTNPNSLPLNLWIGLKVETVNSPNGSVNIKLYTDMNETGIWTLVLESNDDNQTYGGKAITSNGFLGIRTDFMDVEFKKFSVNKIN